MQAEVQQLLSMRMQPLDRLAALSEGYSGSDLVEVCIKAMQRCSQGAYEHATNMHVPAASPSLSPSLSSSRALSQARPSLTSAAFEQLLVNHFQPVTEAALLVALVQVRPISVGKCLWFR